jgi:predicted DNA-binding transcriptional regulator AlpA
MPKLKAAPMRGEPEVEIDLDQLAAKVLAKITGSESGSYSIPAWCARRKVSRATFYNLKAAGKAPRLLKVGNRVTITAESDQEWVARMERETAEHR